MSETNLARAIVEALNQAGAWAFVVNSGRWRVQGGWVCGAPAGTPDICIVDPHGWLEVKLPGLTPAQMRKQSNPRTIAAQARWRSRADARGVRHAVVTSVREACDVVRGWVWHDL